jgi:hypothetical protein
METVILFVVFGGFVSIGLATGLMIESDKAKVILLFISLAGMIFFIITVIGFDIKITVNEQQTKRFETYYSAREGRTK